MLPVPLAPLRRVCVNGRFDATRSDLSLLPDGVECQSLSQALEGDDSPLSRRDVNMIERRWSSDEAGFWQLNAALAEDGVLLRVGPDVEVPLPLHLIFVSTETGADEAMHLRHRIALDGGARLTLVEQHLGEGGQRHLDNSLMHLHVRQGAQLTHIRLQDEADGMSLLARSEVVVARDARYSLLSLELGAALSRHEIAVDLQGEGAMAKVDGLMRTGERRIADTRLMLRHQMPNCASETRWRAIAGGRSRAAFHGGITIESGADGADAQLETRNLLLSGDAEIDAQPVLEIHADEVKASHGATVGQLDAQALFYLRSRGLPEDEARRLLVFAFCRALLDDVEHEPLRTMLTAQVKSHLFRDAEAMA